MSGNGRLARFAFTYDYFPERIADDHGLTNLLSRFFSSSFPRPPQMHLAFMEREGRTAFLDWLLSNDFLKHVYVMRMTVEPYLINRL